MLERAVVEATTPAEQARIAELRARLERRRAALATPDWVAALKARGGSIAAALAGEAPAPRPRARAVPPAAPAPPRPAPPPEPLPDWRELAARGETLVAIGVLDELRFRGRPDPAHFMERARLNERLADETPAEYGAARAARYTEAIQDLRHALAAGTYPGDARFGEREIGRLTSKIAALGDVGFPGR